MRRHKDEVARYILPIRREIISLAGAVTGRAWLIFDIRTNPSPAREAPEHRVRVNRTREGAEKTKSEVSIFRKK